MAGSDGIGHGGFLHRPWPGNTPAASGTAASAIPAPTLDEPATGRAKTETAVGSGWTAACRACYPTTSEAVAIRSKSGYAGGDAATANYDAVTTENHGAPLQTVPITPKPDPGGTTASFVAGLLRRASEVRPNSTVRDPTWGLGVPFGNTCFFPGPRHPAKDCERLHRPAGTMQRGSFPAPVVTAVCTAKLRLSPGGAYPVRNFLDLNPNNPYIVANDLPKLGELKSTFPDLYRD